MIFMPNQREIHCMIKQGLKDQEEVKVLKNSLCLRENLETAKRKFSSKTMTKEYAINIKQD